MTIRKSCMTLILLLICLHTNAQSNHVKATAMGEKAVALADSGKLDEALQLLTDAEKLDPAGHIYAYEKAYCYREKKEYKQGIAEMQRVLHYKSITADCYQMLGNLYDIDGDSVMALKAYADGLKQFPGSGALYLETGNVYLIRKQYGNAIPWYEKGIEADPSYPTNYYRVAQLYTSSTNPIWGMIYGELFMNLERGSERTGDMSGWLYDTYRNNIIIRSKDSMSVTFCRNTTIYADDLMDKKKKRAKKNFRLPFSMVYEPLVLTSMIMADSVNIGSLCSMRKNFLQAYYERSYNKSYPNALFEYQHKIDRAGHLDAYNHWILMRGDETAFTKWQSSHMGEWANFVKWFKDNPISITADNVFLRTKA